MMSQINASVYDMHRNVMGVKPVDEISTLPSCFLASKGVTVLSSKLPIDRIQSYVPNHITGMSRVFLSLK